MNKKGVFLMKLLCAELYVSKCSKTSFKQIPESVINDLLLGSWPTFHRDLEVFQRDLRKKKCLEPLLYFSPISFGQKTIFIYVCLREEIM